MIDEIMSMLYYENNNKQSTKLNNLEILKGQISLTLKYFILNTHYPVC